MLIVSTANVYAKEGYMLLKIRLSILSLFTVVVAHATPDVPAKSCQDLQVPKTFLIDALTLSEHLGLRNHPEVFPLATSGDLKGSWDGFSYYILAVTQNLLVLIVDENTGRVKSVRGPNYTLVDIKRQVRGLKKIVPGLIDLLEALPDKNSTVLGDFEIPDTWNVRLVNSDLVLGRIEWHAYRNKTSKNLLDQALTGP